MTPAEKSTEMLRRVRFDHEDLDAARMMTRSDKAALGRGDRVEVELGARWDSKRGDARRVGGIWVTCEVIADSGKELVVKLLS